jgi:hypothetical protein
MPQRSSQHRERLRTSYAQWLKRRTVLEAYRVKPEARRTTPPPAYDVVGLFPELVGQSATTVRLHPRYGDEPPLHASKLGGTFLWPTEEPWPVCPAHEIPLVSVLQLRADDFPEMPFPPGADLFQMLWCPHEHDDVPECQDKPCPMYWADPRFYWRSCAGIAHARPDNPLPQEAYYEYVPFTCRLLPERAIEYPSVYDLPEGLVERIYEWQDQNLGPDGKHACDYEGELSVAPGTKIGGYLHWIQFPWVPACKCGRPMEHLLTVATVEWDGVGDRRWTPREEQGVFASFPSTWDKWSDRHKEIFSALWNPTGLSLGDGGHMQLFVCRHCGDWPIVPNIECC